MYDTAAQAAGNASRDGRPLESLALAVQRINSAQVRVSRFIDRWHGDSPKEAMSPGEAPGQINVAAPHSVNLERLFQAIDRLETRCDALDAIG